MLTRTPTTTRQTEAIIDRLADWAEQVNLADKFDANFLSDLGSRCIREYNLDEATRREWLDTLERAEERFEMKTEEKNYPFEKAANIKYPLLALAVLQFAARAYAAIIPSRNIVKGKVLGKDDDGSKRERAERMGEHMSYQLLDVIEDWEEETDVLTHQLPLAGCVFRKTFWDEATREPRSEMVCAKDLVVNHESTKSLATVPRITQKFELYPHEIESRIADEIFVDFHYGRTPEGGDDADAPHEFIEQYRLIDLDEDGVREPWIVTVHVASATVARIKANFDAQDIRIHTRERGAIVISGVRRSVQFTKYPFFRDPTGGFYDKGYGHLLDSLGSVINSTLNQLMDAGHLQNAGGGWIGSGVRLKRSHIRLRPGKYEVVQAPGGNIRNAIVNHNHPEPSQTMFALLGMMVEAGERLASVQDISAEAMAPNMPATSVLALIEQGQKMYTAIYKRIYRALKQEFGILRGINARHIDQEEYFRLHDDEKAVARADYAAEDLDVIPISDPNMTSDTQKLARAQVVAEGSANPNWVGLHDQRVACRRFYDAASIENVDELVPPEPELTEEQQAAAQQEEQMAKELTQRGATAEVAKLEGEAQKAQAEAVAKAAEAKGEEDDRQLKAAEVKIKAEDSEGKARQIDLQGAELDLKQKELDLKERELDLKARQIEIDAGVKGAKAMTDVAKVQVAREHHATARQEAAE